MVGWIWFGFGVVSVVICLLDCLVLCCGLCLIWNWCLTGWVVFVFYDALIVDAYLRGFYCNY